jgi:hypothetical protein
MLLEGLTRVPRGSNKALIWSDQAHRWYYKAVRGSYRLIKLHILVSCSQMVLPGLQIVLPVQSPTIIPVQALEGPIIM